jgi:hypothetical protein
LASPYAVAEATAPTQPVRSLLRAARVLVGEDANAGVEGDWRQGFEIRPDNCVEAELYDPICIGPMDEPPFAEPAPDRLDSPVNEPGDFYYPFLIETSFECNSTGIFSRDDEARVLRQLNASIPKAVENALWTGMGNVERKRLASPDATVLGAGAVDPVEALGLLSEALGNCGAGGRGMIHGPELAINAMLGDNRIIEEGENLVTKVRKDFVIPGSGYPGTAPNGAAPAAGTEWVYATRIVTVRLEATPTVLTPEGMLRVDELTGRRINWVQVRAQIAAAVSFDCCQYGVLVTVT